MAAGATGDVTMLGECLADGYLRECPAPERRWWAVAVEVVCLRASLVPSVRVLPER